MPSCRACGSYAHGWALAETANEARRLSGYDNAIITRKPDHIWIVQDRLVWESRAAPKIFPNQEG